MQIRIEARYAVDYKCDGCGKMEQGTTRTYSGQSSSIEFAIESLRSSTNVRNGSGMPVGWRSVWAKSRDLFYCGACKS